MRAPLATTARFLRAWGVALALGTAHCSLAYAFVLLGVPGPTAVKRRARRGAASRAVTALAGCACARTAGAGPHARSPTAPTAAPGMARVREPVVTATGRGGGRTARSDAAPTAAASTEFATRAFARARAITSVMTAARGVATTACAQGTAAASMERAASASLAGRATRASSGDVYSIARVTAFAEMACAHASTAFREKIVRLLSRLRTTVLWGACIFVLLAAPRRLRSPRAPTRPLVGCCSRRKRAASPRAGKSVSRAVARATSRRSVLALWLAAGGWATLAS